MTRFVVKGINDDKSFCECCGRENLKCVVWIEDTETGEIKHFGSTCAGKPAKGFDCGQEIKRAVTSLRGYIKYYTQSTLSQYKSQGGKFETVDGVRKAADMVLWVKLWDENEKRAIVDFNRREFSK